MCGAPCPCPARGGFFEAQTVKTRKTLQVKSSVWCKFVRSGSFSPFLAGECGNAVASAIGIFNVKRSASRWISYCRRNRWRGNRLARSGPWEGEGSFPWATLPHAESGHELDDGAIGQCFDGAVLLQSQIDETVHVGDGGDAVERAL